MIQHKSFVSPTNATEGLLHGNVLKFLGVFAIQNAYVILALVNEAPPVTKPALLSASGAPLPAAVNDKLPAWRFRMYFDGQEVKKSDLEAGMVFLGHLLTQRGPAYIWVMKEPE